MHRSEKHKTLRCTPSAHNRRWNVYLPKLRDNKEGFSAENVWDFIYGRLLSAVPLSQKIGEMSEAEGCYYGQDDSRDLIMRHGGK